MVAPIVPILAGTVGSVLLNKLWDAVSQAGSEPAIDEGSSVGGAGRVYDAGSQPVMAGGKQPTVVVNSPNRAAEGSQPSPTSSNAQQQQTSTQQRIESNKPAAGTAQNMLTEGDVAGDGKGGSGAAPQDTANSHVGTEDLLNSLIAAAAAGGLGYGASRYLNRSPDAGIRLEPEIGVGGNVPAVANDAAKAGVPAKAGSTAVAANGRGAASNVVDAEWSPVNDIAADTRKALPAPQQKLTGPQATAPAANGTQEVADATGKQALPAPEAKAINLPDETSGATVAADSRVFDKANARAMNIGGKTMYMQGNNVFDQSGKFVGEATKIFPAKTLGVLRTLGVIKRGL